jgi:7,8-dihydro-6-hydroxymethylpterin-pyrophosphokinase
MELTMPVAPTAPNHRDLDLVLPPDSCDPSDSDAATVPHEKVAQAAYLIAEARGFLPGAELDDWLAAEQGLQRLHPVSLPA